MSPEELEWRQALKASDELEWRQALKASDERKAPGEALRYDDGKSRVDLIDPNFILALGDHYQRGAKKYAERNWEKGMLFSRCYASAQRHLLAFWAGEDTDAETGTLHVVAVAWNMAAIHHYMNDPALREKFDDRPRKGLANFACSV